MVDSVARRLPRLARRAAGAVIFLLATSCALLPWGRTVHLELRLPPPPPGCALFGREGFDLVIPDQEGGWETRRVPPGITDLEVVLFKGPMLPLRAYPLLNGRPDLLRPAGGVYPATLDDRGEMALRYEEGFLAELLAPLVACEAVAGALNVQRLREELMSRSSGNPWKLDRRSILDGLAYGVMRSQRIAPRPTHTLVLPVPPGHWITGNPLDLRSQVVDDGGSLHLPGLPLGIHHLVRLGEEERGLIDVEIGEEGWMAIDGVTGGAESGRW